MKCMCKCKCKWTRKGKGKGKKGEGRTRRRKRKRKNKELGYIARFRCLNLMFAIGHVIALCYLVLLLDMYCCFWTCMFQSDPDTNVCDLNLNVCDLNMNVCDLDICV